MATLAEDIKQAKELKRRLCAAIVTLGPKFSKSTEFEISFRHTTAVNVLTILLRDTTNMIECWEELNAP